MPVSELALGAPFLRTCVRWVATCVLLLLIPAPVWADNLVQIENAKPGTSEWRLTNPATNREIEGYAGSTSVPRGGQIRFFIHSTAASYTLEVFRLGWYGGLGGRRITAPVTLGGVQQAMPSPDPVSGLVECGWASSYLLSVSPKPGDASDWASGVYVAKLTADNGKQNYILFVVGEDGRASDYLMQVPATSYQAHNNWGGKSLYDANSTGGRARKVSFNRPFAGEGNDGTGGFLGGWDYNLLRFLEKEGYDVTYATDFDIHSKPPLPANHRALIMAGRNEFWSWQYRGALIAAREQGVGLGFFSGANGVWQARYEPSSSGAPDRTIVAYQEDALSEDPYYLDSDSSNDHLVTTRWRDLPLLRPEEAIVGVMYESAAAEADLVIADPSHWAFAGTGLGAGDRLPGLLGSSADRSFGVNPPGTQILGYSPYTSDTGDSQYSNMSSYRAESGAVVFAAGTPQWAWGLDDFNVPEKRSSRLSAAAKQITRNVLARFVAPNFKVSASPSSFTTKPGNKATYTISVSALGGYTGTVNFTADGLPADATYTVTPNSVTGSGSATLGINTQSTSPTGTYTITITASDGSATQTVTTSLLLLDPIPRTGWKLKYVDSEETSCALRGGVKSFDSQASTFWQTKYCGSQPPPPHEIQIELPSTYAMSGFWYLPRQDGCSQGWIKDYEFYTSNDGFTWTLATSGAFNYGNASFGCPGATVIGARQISFPPAAGRFIRLRALSEVTGLPYTSMAEITLLGTLVNNQAPDGTITAPGSNTTVTVGQWLSLAATGWDPDSNVPLRYEWNFGGGSGIPISGEQNPTVQFNRVGVFDVVMTVTDALGLADPVPPVRSVTVLPIQPGSLTIDPAAVVGGTAATATLTLSAPAPAGGAVIELASSHAAASVPASVTVAAGASTATFSINTVPVGSGAVVVISASYNSGSETAILEVHPATPASVAINPASVIGGSAGQGTVTLNGVAASGGTVVALSSSDPAVASVPANITVPAGVSSASFPVATNPVGSANAVTISAASGGVTRSANFTVTLAQAGSLALSPNSLIGGTSSRGTVTLSGAAPGGGAAVTLASDSSAVTVPASVTVPAGQTSAVFDVATTPVPTFTQATVTGSYGGGTVTAAINVKVATPTAVTLNPAAVVGGSSAQGTIPLGGPAPAGGTTITLTSNNPAVAGVPSSVTVPEGASSASFTISTTPVAGNTQVVITAKFRLQTQSATLEVNPPTPTEVTLGPGAVIGGTASQATVRLSGPAAEGGVVVVLASSGSAATVPDSVTVPAGASSAEFTVSTTPVSATTSPTIFALYNGVTKNAVLTVNAAAPSAISLNPSTVIGGATVEAAVTLNGPAPAGGTTVVLSSSDPAATAPASVVVPSGATTTTFSITTTPVAVLTQPTISAAYGGASQSATLSVKPAAITRIGLNPSAVVGGTAVEGTVYLNGAAAAGGATVTLASSDAAASVPESITVPAGASSVTFALGTTPVALGRTATITATFRGLSEAVDLEIRSPSPTALVIDPALLVGGTQAQGTVTLNGAAPAGGAAIALSSSDPVASVPVSVTVAAGASTATFTVSTSPVSAFTQSTIAASYNGITKTATVSVKVPTPSAITLAPAALTGGGSVQVSVELNGPAPGEGVTVSLLSSDGGVAAVPASLTILAGTSSATATLTTTPVAAATPVTISAKYKGTTQEAVLTVQPPGLAALTLSSVSVIGGSETVASLALNGPAPAGGSPVAISWSGGPAGLPQTITVPAGATTASFTVATAPVGTTTQLTITASLNDGTQTAMLEVRPATPLSLTLSPNTVVGGTAAQGTVILSGPAPSGGTAVALTSSDPAAAPPATIIVPEGVTTAAFSITTVPVTVFTETEIAASFGGVTQTARLTVKVATMTGVTLNPPSVVGSLSAEGTITLKGPAPAGGTVITLASSDPAVVVPSSVTVPAGASSVNFALSTASVTATTTVTITATFRKATQTATLEVRPAVAGSLALDPVLVIGGNASQATYTLSGPAPLGGATIALASSSPAASLPASLTIPAGQASATFTVSTVPVTQFTQATITADYGGVARTATLSIKVATPSALALAPAAVPGGGSSLATVTLNGAAPAEGIVINLFSSDVSAATLPSTVLLAGGQTSATFEVSSKPVAAITQVTISAKYKGTAQDAVLTVQPPALSSLQLNPASVTGGDSSQATVTLNGPAPAGAVVNLTSSDAVAQVPESVTIPAGTTSATFAVATSFAAADKAVTISGTYLGVTQSATLSVNATPQLASLTLTPGTLAGGGAATGTVTLMAPAPAGGVTVSLASSNGAVASLPASVTIPAGASSATFSVATTTVTSSKTVTISATTGSTTKTATLTVTPVLTNLASSASVTVSSQNVFKGQQGVKAIDGVVSGCPTDCTKEWATMGQAAGAWIRLTWSSPATISQIVLHDRPNSTENVRSGTLTFSDGSSVAVGTLPNNGSAHTVNFSTRTVSWVTFRVDTASGASLGLAEIKVMGWR